MTNFNFLVLLAVAGIYGAIARNAPGSSKVFKGKKGLG